MSALAKPPLLEAAPPCCPSPHGVILRFLLTTAVATARSLAYTLCSVPDKPPDRLYKYQPFSEYSLENLALRQIFFSKPIDLNDPFEFDVKLDFGSTPKEELRHFASEYLAKEGRDESVLDMPSEFIELAFHHNMRAMNDDLLRTSGVACFSEVRSHPLLWAHYAAQHQGFCLEFSSGSWIVRDAIRVHYSSERPSVGPLEFHNNDSLRMQAATKLALKQALPRY